MGVLLAIAVIFLKAISVFDNFIDAIKDYGIPSRIRCDHGIETVDVCA